MVRVSSIIAFLVMKGMALHDRLKENDAWCHRSSENVVF